MAARTWIRPMSGRDPDEDHRTATPLELLFDLCYVVAVSQAAHTFADFLVEGHVGDGLVGFVMAFFAIWWAWMNFTWFASAYDTDDVPYRLLTLLQITGVLVLAAGVPDAFDREFGLVVIGYVIMRIALVGQWLRAARSDPEHRGTAQRYAGGVTALQLVWVVWLLVPEEAQVVVWVVFAIGELALPYWAEQAGLTPWHPSHIAERYGLFTIIVLGECILGSTVAIEQAASDGLTAEIFGVAFGGLLLVLGIWWIYFRERFEETLHDHRWSAFRFGYAHYFVFGAIAALGAGIEVAAEASFHAIELSDVGIGLAVAIPIAAFLLALSALSALLGQQTARHRVWVTTAVVVILAVGLLAGAIGPSLSIALMGVVILLDVVAKEVLEPVA